MNYSEAEIIETLARAQTAALAKKWSEAECLLRPIAEHPGALHLLGLILLEQKHFGQGVEKLEKALLLGGAFSLHEVLARQYFQEGMFHDAARQK